MTKVCPECKNSLDESAFSWYGNVCNGCGKILESKPRDSDQKKCLIQSCKGRTDCLPHCPCDCHIEPWETKLATIWDWSWSINERDEIYKKIKKLISTTLVTARWEEAKRIEKICQNGLELRDMRVRQEERERILGLVKEFENIK